MYTSHTNILQTSHLFSQFLHVWSTKDLWEPFPVGQGGAAADATMAGAQSLRGAAAALRQGDGDRGISGSP